MKTLHISNRTETMLCGEPCIPGAYRRYLFADRDAFIAYGDCEACLEREPMAELAATDLEGGKVPLCTACGVRAGTHHASYDGRWTCERCIF